MKKIVIIIGIGLVALHGCTGSKVYENDNFPHKNAHWQPVNPEYFSLTEAQRIFEGTKPK